MATVVVSNMLGQAYVAALPVLAYEEFGRSSRVAGLFYAASGIGAVAGAVVAFRLVSSFRPLRLAAAGMLLGSLPRWLLALPLPAGGVAGSVAARRVLEPGDELAADQHHHGADAARPVAEGDVGDHRVRHRRGTARPRRRGAAARCAWRADGLPAPCGRHDGERALSSGSRCARIAATAS
jgi:hypothetical protein